MQENTRIRIYYSRWSVVMSIAGVTHESIRTLSYWENFHFDRKFEVEYNGFLYMEEDYFLVRWRKYWKLIEES